MGQLIVERTMTQTLKPCMKKLGFQSVTNLVWQLIQ